LISKREQGGPVTRGTPYIVGEKRAEVFVPDQNGTILPSTEGAGGGGRSANFTFNINAVDSEGIDTLLTERMPLFKSMVAEFFEESGQLSPI